MSSGGESSTANGENQSYKGPVHLLMAAPPRPGTEDGDRKPPAKDSSYTSRQQRQWELDPRLQRDFIGTRAKAFDVPQQEKNKRGEPIPFVWRGVSRAEQELVNCCEVPEGEDDILKPPMKKSSYKISISYRDEYPIVGYGGALDRRKEVRFCGVLAKSCHTPQLRALALAILERTIETTLYEKFEAEEAAKEKTTKLNGTPEPEEEEEEDDDFTNGRKRRSRRLQKQQPRPKYKRTKRKEETPAKAVDPTSEKTQRLEQFVAAGGLRILSRWLHEACEDIPEIGDSDDDDESVGSDSKSVASSKSGETWVLKRSPTRALILPILRFLEQIPFDKKLVLDSKINKQIRTVEKQVDTILKDLAKGEADPEDVQDWSANADDKPEEALEQVKGAIKEIKKTWGAKTKSEKKSFPSPFEEAYDTLKDRLEQVDAFEAGREERPEWLVFPEEKKQAKSKLSRSELFKKERQRELEIQKDVKDEALMKKLKETQQKYQEQMASFRQKRQMMFEANATSTQGIQKKSTGRKIRWTDGMNSKTYRDRTKLEEVFSFNKLTPANKDIVEPLGGEDGVAEAMNGTKEGPEPMEVYTNGNKDDDDMAVL